MPRVPLALIFCLAAFSPAYGANFWLSFANPNSGGFVPPQAPTTVGAIETKTQQPSTTGTFYIWARPTAGKTLENWGLKVVTSIPNIVSFGTSSVEAYNTCLSNCSGEDIVRWEFIGEPTGSNVSSIGLQGLNIFGVDRSGVGLGPANDGSPYNDPYYYAANSAWLLASVNYTALAVGNVSVSLQISDIGMNHVGESSSETTAIFGLTSDPPLNAHSQRNKSDIDSPFNGTAELFINVATATPGDFDSDTDIDGRDFLAWQRGQSPLPFSPTNLATWQNAYNGGALSGLKAIPEPATAALLGLMALTMSLRSTRCLLAFRS